MLAHDTLPKRNTNAVVKNKSLNQRDFRRKSSPSHSHNQEQTLNKNPRHVQERNNHTSQSSESIQYPLWLKSFIVLNHFSSIICGLSVGTALVIYGMTVYAPKQWTNKYHQLQNLQKQERQFTFTDEVLKDTLAESAQQQGSGFVNPDQSKPPIFLPETNATAITPKSINPVKIKKVKPIYPVAY
ncbi:hypothetical protein [Cyanobacterium aponinum]|uniref:Cell division protein FtsL n=1 Tax=Cyanobacterium aponinum 0216 TaxID=2676140 RepID=A0A844GWS7_9CHRO|nr:hypothetical protein [Cyanobacterium aponinum]MTF38645.1 hypothetical protein [Cyanobacterium aponinum 0216]